MVCNLPVSLRMYHINSPIFVFFLNFRAFYFHKLFNWWSREKGLKASKESLHLSTPSGRHFFFFAHINLGKVFLDNCTYHGNLPSITAVLLTKFTYISGRYRRSHRCRQVNSYFSLVSYSWEGRWTNCYRWCGYRQDWSSGSAVTAYYHSTGRLKYLGTT